jgi:hypothetical protein
MKVGVAYLDILDGRPHARVIELEIAGREALRVRIPLT